MLNTVYTHRCLRTPGPLSGGGWGRTFWWPKLGIFVRVDPKNLIFAMGFFVKVDYPVWVVATRSA